MDQFENLLLILCFLVVYVALPVLTIMGYRKMFEKAGKPGIAAIVPIWNIMVIHEIRGESPYRILWYFVPVANLVIFFVDIIDLPRAYGKSANFGVGLLLLPFVFAPILGFGSSECRVIPPTRSQPIRVSGDLENYYNPPSGKGRTRRTTFED